MSGLFLTQPEFSLNIDAPLLSLVTITEAGGDFRQVVTTSEGAVKNEDNWVVFNSRPVKSAGSIVLNGQLSTDESISVTPADFTLSGPLPEISKIEVNDTTFDFTLYDGTLSSIEGDGSYALTPGGFENPLRAFDITAPVVQFPVYSIKMNPGTPYTPQATALDDSEGDLAVSYNNPVDVNEIGIYTVEATATDSAGNTGTATQTVEVKNLIAPQVTVSADATVESGTEVIINGSIVPGDGEIVSYEWVQVSGQTVVLNNATTLNPGYSAPAISGPELLVFELSAIDDLGEVGTATVTHTVKDTIAPVITRLGPESVTIKIGDTYTDQGFTASDNIDGVISPIINNPVDPRFASVYTVTATATDNAGNTANLTRTVTVANLTGPTAYAGVDINVAAGRSAELNGAGSSAGDREIVRYAWQQISGRSVVIANPNSAITSYTVPAITGPESIVFRLTVTDKGGSNHSAEVTHQIIDVEPPVITIISGGETVVAGEEWVDYGANVRDNVDGIRKIFASSKPDVSAPGTVEAIYEYTDAAGNQAAPATRTINVLAPYNTTLSNTLSGVDVEFGEYRVRLYSNIYDNSTLVFDGTVNISESSYSINALRVAPGTTLFGFALHHRFGGFPITGVAE